MGLANGLISQDLAMLARRPDPWHTQEKLCLVTQCSEGRHKDPCSTLASPRAKMASSTSVERSYLKKSKVQWAKKPLMMSVHKHSTHTCVHTCTRTRTHRHTHTCGGVGKGEGILWL